MNRTVRLSIRTIAIACPLVFVPSIAWADQVCDMADMQAHHMHMMAKPGSIPTLPGQEAFGTVQEIVQILEADPKTDWSKVDLENLRQHLIDMNEVVLNSQVKSTQIPGGLSMEVTGTGRTEQAIQSMVVAHAAMLDQMPQWSARAEKIAGGVTLTVKAKNPNDDKLVAKIRGLGFIGLLTQGSHHQLHHLAMARGDRSHSHQH